METIGRYRLVRRLGAGSFATVFLGHDDSLDVPVAIKVLAENWSANEDVRQRFLAEARIMRKIRDKRIVQVYDIGTLEDGRPYFVMDYIDGGSLDDLRKQRIEPERALRLCAEACRALQVLHDNDIIHRDVTPGNLLVSRGPNGETLVLVADLGVAKSMIDAVGATMTAGTPSYMAMEQATGIGVLDHRADVYSLCALTYAMLTGEPPFRVRSLADILGRNPQAEPEKLADRLGAPAILDALMVSGLSTDAQRRPPTAAVLGQALDSIADQMHAASAAVSPLPESTTLRPSPSTSYPQSPAQSPGTTPPIPSGDSPNSMIGPPGPGQPSHPGHGPQPGYGYGSPGTQPPAYPTTPATQLNPYLQSHVAPIPSQQQPALINQPEQGRRRPTTFYVLIGLGALALFAITLFITLTALNG
ncbi:serine/threonine-protein kinase [Microlunatus speluncae]|uniref:serine/threonine-protein kinase n=1 Tax=Microlunatus speluncae TaxID=2594267 RepID=UPI001FE66D21|nr:serine/threonine-protein kinase [Microlunatus speluncae]